jgi:hypothetical protein
MNRDTRQNCTSDLIDLRLVFVIFLVTFMGPMFHAKEE